jgi:membrane associated rhomboid family serine protease
MIPYGDSKLIGAPFPFVTYFLMLVNIVVFVLNLPNVETSFDIYKEFAMVPKDVLEFKNLKSNFTWFFLHGSLMHIGGNMLFLFIFGDNIEAALGHLGFLFFYVVGGLISGFIHIASEPFSTIPVVGASGAVSACMGAYIVMYPTSKIKLVLPLLIVFIPLTIPAWSFLGYWIGLQTYEGVRVLRTGSTSVGIAWWAHIGGFAFGFLQGLRNRKKAKKYEIRR